MIWFILSQKDIKFLYTFCASDFRHFSCFSIHRPRELEAHSTNDVRIFFSHFLSSSNDCQREGLLDHCEDISAEENNANTAQDSGHWSSSRTWSQASDHSFTSWKKRLRHSIEVVRQFRGRRPREYSINEDAPSLRPPAPPGSHTTILLSIFARLNELCDYFQSLQMPYRPLELSHNFFDNMLRI